MTPQWNLCFPLACGYCPASKMTLSDIAYLWLQPDALYWDGRSTLPPKVIFCLLLETFLSTSDALWLLSWPPGVAVRTKCPLGLSFQENSVVRYWHHKGYWMSLRSTETAQLYILWFSQVYRHSPIHSKKEVFQLSMCSTGTYQRTEMLQLYL